GRMCTTVSTACSSPAVWLCCPGRNTLAGISTSNVTAAPANRSSAVSGTSPIVVTSFQDTHETIACGTMCPALCAGLFATDPYGPERHFLHDKLVFGEGEHPGVKLHPKQVQRHRCPGDCRVAQVNHHVERGLQQRVRRWALRSLAQQQADQGTVNV